MLPEPMLTYYQVAPEKYILWMFLQKRVHAAKYIGKCHLQNISHSCPDAYVIIGQHQSNSAVILMVWPGNMQLYLPWMLVPGSDTRITWNGLVDHGGSGNKIGGIQATTVWENTFENVVCKMLAIF